LKTPAWFSARLADIGTRVRAGEITEDRAVSDLSRSVTANRPLMAMLAAEFCGRELGRWLRRRGRPGEQGALFPALPEQLDVAPGTFRAQGAMTRHDWQMHLRIAQNRRDNAIDGAKAHFASVLAAYSTVMPLLTSDEMTTAEALRRRTLAA
jgi:hypothetical protein